MKTEYERPKLRKCITCQKVKRLETEFYFCIVQYRTKCKECHSAETNERQKKLREHPKKSKAFIKKRRKYMREYYLRRKENASY